MLDKKNNKQRRRSEGIVVSHGGKKTAVVKVERYFMHPKYQKFIKRSKKFKAHDESDSYKVGDRVVIEESSPISKDKHWKII